MLKNLIFIAFFLGWALPSLGQELLIRGQVKDAESQTKIPGVHVLIKGQQQGAVTDIDGNFVITVNRNDTLGFSYVGYQPKVYLVASLPVENDEVNVEIDLAPSTTTLESVDVFAYKNARDFKNAVIALELPEEEKVEIYIPGFYNGPKREVKAGAGSPISALVNKFGKRAKQERKFQNMKAKHQVQFKYAEKYNKEIVARITGLKDEELQDFMEYCTLSENFVVEANEYEIIVAVNKCYEDFKNSN